MLEFQELIVSENASLEEAISIIDQTGHGIVFVVDNERKLLGSLSDGDIRRAILKHLPLSTLVKEVMNPSPKTVSVDVSPEDILKIMELHKINYVPVLDESRRVIGIMGRDEVIGKSKRENLAVIMCGGKGERLLEFTKNCPKPLLSIGGQPLLETIILQLRSYGFKKIIMATHYLSDKISDYFGDGYGLGVKITYVKEKKRIGTAGALTLIKEKNDLPILVMNGDILTKVNIDHFFQYHNHGNYKLTMGVTRYEFRVPFGVISMDDGQKVVNLQEKPKKYYFINAGIYILNPELIDLIPVNKYYDMTDLINKLIDMKYPIGSFPIREYWTDIGQIEDMIKANDDFPDHFQ